MVDLVIGVTTNGVILPLNACPWLPPSGGFRYPYFRLQAAFAIRGFRLQAEEPQDEIAELPPEGGSYEPTLTLNSPDLRIEVTLAPCRA